MFSSFFRSSSFHFSNLFYWTLPDFVAPVFRTLIFPILSCLFLSYVYMAHLDYRSLHLYPPTMFYAPHSDIKSLDLPLLSLSVYPTQPY